MGIFPYYAKAMLPPVTCTAVQAGSLMMKKLPVVSTACRMRYLSSNSSKDGSQQNLLTHLDPATGRPRMVDVGGKSATHRSATAACSLTISQQLRAHLLTGSGALAKGHVMSTAELAGVMGAKRTSDLIPLCHQLALTSVKVAVALHTTDARIDVDCRVECVGQTGVEMEALTGCSIAALTVYDMCKAVDKGIVIGGLHLVEKTGGKSGDYKSTGAARVGVDPQKNA